MCILPGLVGLDLGLGEGLDGDGEEISKPDTTPITSSPS